MSRKYYLEMPRLIAKTRSHPVGCYFKTSDLLYHCQDCGSLTNTFQFYEKDWSVKVICVGMVIDNENLSNLLEDLVLDFSAIKKKYERIKNRARLFRHTDNNIILLKDF